MIDNHAFREKKSKKGLGIMLVGPTSFSTARKLSENGSRVHISIACNLQLFHSSYRSSILKNGLRRVSRKCVLIFEATGL